MHNLAIALARKGYSITGSDDEIFEPSRSRLRDYGLLPEETGWFPGKIHRGLDAVVLGMHARDDNPELKKAAGLGVRIYSYPEFLYEHSKEKTRIVIGGSHGKTTITAMLLHVIRRAGVHADFMVGAQLKGFDVMVQLSDEASLMILEGDEYLTSAIDRRPKFHIYKPHLALISGISWDHINVFPTWEGYRQEFIRFINLIEPGGALVYCNEEPEVVRVADEAGVNLKKIPYGLPEYKIIDGITSIVSGRHDISLEIFGRHNLLNMEGARKICHLLGIGDDQFYAAIASFPGASNRLELLAGNSSTSVYKDFAHSPSKLKATADAVKEQFPHRQLVACMELHTFSSLNEHFLDHYSGTLDNVDIPLVYFNPHTIELKRLPALSEKKIRMAFNNDNLRIFTDSQKLADELEGMDWTNRNLLMMSSGNFDDLQIRELAERIAGKEG